MTEKDRLQKELIDIFIDKFKKYGGGLNLCTPLIPRVTSRYLDSRVIVIGQETNTWYNKTKDDLKEDFLSNLGRIEKICVEERYENFILNFADRYGGKFWNFTKLLYQKEIINGEMIIDGELGHCWMNFFSVEACQSKKDEMGRPTKNRKLANEVIKLQEDLLLQSIKILRPKLILLLTGNSLDWFLTNKALKIDKYEFRSVDENQIIETSQLAELAILDKSNVLSKMKIIRGYHPTYFMARINTFGRLQNRIKEEGVDSTNSKYYTELLINVLKK
jgi:hypothetical protein